MEVIERPDIPQAEIWPNVKELISRGYQVFAFRETEAGTFDIRAVKGLIGPHERDGDEGHVST